MDRITNFIPNFRCRFRLYYLIDREFNLFTSLCCCLGSSAELCLLSGFKNVVLGDYHWIRLIEVHFNLEYLRNFESAMCYEFWL